MSSFIKFIFIFYFFVAFVRFLCVIYGIIRVLEKFKIFFHRVNTEEYKF